MNSKVLILRERRPGIRSVISPYVQLRRLPSQVKGARFRSLSRRSSRVQISPSAPLLIIKTQVRDLHPLNQMTNVARSNNPKRGTDTCIQTGCILETNTPPMMSNTISTTIILLRIAHALVVSTISYPPELICVVGYIKPHPPHQSH